MFRASLCPSSGEQECALPHMVHCESYCSTQSSDSTICDSAHSCPPDDGHNDARKHVRDKSLIINIRLVASCWFLSLHPTFVMRGHKSLKLSMYVNLQIFRLLQHYDFAFVGL